MRILEYFTSLERIALERTCPDMYAFSLDCPLPWKVTLDDKWYWSSPHPNEYTIRRGEKQVRRKVVANYDFTCVYKSIPTVYWKGEESMTIKLDEFYDHVEVLAFPHTLVMRANYDERIVPIEPGCGTLWELLIEDEVARRQMVPCWAKFCEHFIQRQYPLMQLPYCLADITIRWEEGKWVESRLNWIYWVIGRDGFRNQMEVFHHRNEWLDGPISFEADLFSDGGDITPIRVEGAIGQTDVDLNLSVGARELGIEDSLRLNTCTLRCFHEFSISDTFPKVHTLHLFNLKQPFSISGKFLRTYFPALRHLSLLFIQDPKINTDGFPTTLESLTVHKLCLFGAPITIPVLKYDIFEGEDTLWTEIVVEEEMWYWGKGYGSLKVIGSLVISKGVLHISGMTQEVPSVISAQIRHLFVNANILPPLFTTHPQHWDRLEKITFTGKKLRPTHPSVRKWITTVGRCIDIYVMVKEE